MTDLVRQLTADGSRAFMGYVEAIRAGAKSAPPFELLSGTATSADLPFEAHVEHSPGGTSFPNRFEFGRYLVDRLSVAQRASISLNVGLWNWLSLYYFEALCPIENGQPKPREVAAYVLQEQYRHTRYYRHLVRSPWLAFAMHGEASRALLIPASAKAHPLATTGEIFEQVASRQGVWRSTNVVASVDAMYFDENAGRPRAGTAGSGGGSPRRLGAILRQFEKTFDLEWGSHRNVLSLLPKEFNSWKRHAGM